MNYASLKKVFFRFDPEKIHNLTEESLYLASKYAPFIIDYFHHKNHIRHESLSQQLFGVTFPNPVGLGAGFDKNGTLLRAVNLFGFGFSEIGTVTPRPQEGNPKPRLFRHIAHNSLQNAMGFNNHGAEAMQKMLRYFAPYSIPIGINIGKNKTTPEEKAIEDYLMLIKMFHEHATYITINISSPNTPNLRDLQNEAFVKALFTEATRLTQKPILLKIAPDMSIDNALSLCDTAIQSGAGGIIATNTTIDYSLIPNAKHVGGLSGEVLKEKSYQLFKEIGRTFYGKTTLISVGGIDSGAEALRRIRAGANLVEVYSSLIYKGPSHIRQINEQLYALLSQGGFAHIKEAIGSDYR